MTVTKYNKLVRDNIPNIIERDGKKVKIAKLDDEEYIKALNLKLDEELEEYIETNNIEELVDMVEVIYGILDYYGVSIEEFEKIRNEKARKRGAFKEKILLIEVIED
ncbi:MAG: nucleoside triphosphate pyrophosphohydrolase [Tissierellia bacterium]|nr:nucleoside triphosphate pyrophosphohydrolase [Tissierellia bacterium]